METPFTIARSDDLTYTTLPGGSIGSGELLIYDTKKTKVLRIERNDESSLHVVIVNEQGNERSGYIRAKNKDEIGRRKLDEIETEANNLLGTSYDDLLHHQFVLNSKALEINLSDRVRVRTALKGQVREGEHGEVAPHFEFVEREEETADPRFPKRDVNVSMTMNRRDDKYDKVVQDAKTGEVIHEKHGALSKHHSKRKPI